MTRLRLGFARLAASLLTLLFWTWLAVKGAVTAIGATTVVDDFNLMLGRLPLWAEWLFTTPWWVPAVLAATLTVFLMWLSWPRPQPAYSGDAITAPIASQAPPPKPKPYLKQAYIDPNPGHRTGVPEYHAIPERNGREAVISLEFEHYLNAPGEHRWSKRRKILLAEWGRFHAGLWELVRVPVMWKHEDEDGAARWYWGRSDMGPQPDLAVLNLPYRCRVVFKGPEGLIEPTYFVVERQDESDNPIPRIRDYYWTFGFKDEWEADD